MVKVAAMAAVKLRIQEVIIIMMRVAKKLVVQIAIAIMEPQVITAVVVMIVLMLMIPA